MPRVAVNTEPLTFEQYMTLEETGTLAFACLDFVMTLEEIYEDVVIEAKS